MFVHLRQDLFREILGESVIDINVIAGENGVGKTQLLKLLAEVTSGAATLDHLVGYNYVLVHQVGADHLVLSSNIDIEYYPEPLDGFGMSQQGNVVSPVIYYSPFLDFNPLDINTHEKRKPIIDISQSFYVMQDTEQSQKRMDVVPAILAMKSNNILRQIDFVVQKPLKVEMPFRLPSQLDVKFNRLSVNQDDVSVHDRDLFDKLTAYCAAFFGESDRNGISQAEMAKLMFYRNLLSLFFLSVNNNKSQSILHHRFGDGLISEIDAFSGDDPQALLELFERFFKADDVFMNRIFERLISISFSIIDSQGTSVTFDSGNNNLTLTLPAGDQRIVRLLKEMFQPEENISNKYIGKELVHFIFFDWRNFSSGEKSFFDLFSRLFAAKKQLGDPSDTVVLLLDEAEIGFHPEWQKRFVSYLVGFLNSVFQGFSLQVVMATHSPLVLSDFPSERVHLFKRENEEVVRGIGFGTFAQNIPELLAREFFIDTTLIGNLAKQYIDNILELTRENSVEQVREKVEEIVAMIGKIDEPVIKRLLLENLEEKLDAGN